MSSNCEENRVNPVASDWWNCANAAFHNNVEEGIEQSHDDCPRCRARAQWNAKADGWNQWTELSEDEKAELTAHEVNSRIGCYQDGEEGQ